MTTKTRANPQAQIRDLETKLHIETTLRQIQNRVHTASVDEIMLSVRDEVRKLLGCERVTIYLKDSIRPEIVSKVKDGNELKEIRLTIGPHSLAGYVAFSGKPLRLSNAYDPNESAKIDPDLHFNPDWDRSSGYTTKQVLAVPVQKDGRLHGVIQALNTIDEQPFNEKHQRVVEELAEALAIACANRQKLHIRATPHDTILREQLVTQAEYDRAVSTATKDGKSVEWVLMNHFNVPINEIGRSLRDFFRCDFVAYQPKLPAPKETLEKFSVEYLKLHGVVPIEVEGERAVVLMANPRSLNDRDDVQRKLGVSRMLVKVAMREHILDFIDEFYGLRSPDQATGSAPNLDPLFADLEKEAEKAKLAEEVEEGGAKAEDDKGIIGLVNWIIKEGAASRASDIHIEPRMVGPVKVRFRIDGNCIDKKLPGDRDIPNSWGRAMVARIKIMSNLDIAERRLPQDGKIRFREWSDLDIELRVATLPTTGGTEDVVMRILASSKPMKLDELKMLPENLERFRKVIALPYGIVLCVGPTGSGKTTTLHAALGALNEPDVKIWTAEDPVEITQEGLRQVQVQSKIGFTFERALRAFLRADPDIIMIGEMRDAETAGAAVEASLTGHMVFSTLHTNSASETVTRLLDLGLDPFSFGDSLLAVLAQRLVRSLCKHCKVAYACSDEEFAKIRAEYGDDPRFDALGLKPKDLKLHKPVGCLQCNKSGYRGRIGIHELLVSDDEIRLMVYRKAKSVEIRDASIAKGMIMLKQDGIRKVMEGLTDMREVLAVASK